MSYFIVGGIVGLLAGFVLCALFTMHIYKQNERVTLLLKRIMHKIRNDYGGSEDPMEPFSYDLDWEHLAIAADEIIAEFDGK